MKPSNLRKRIEEIVRELDCGYCETSHDHEASRQEEIANLLSLFSQTMEEVIGEDEPGQERRTAVDEMFYNHGISYRNKFRQEARRRLRGMVKL